MKATSAGPSARSGQAMVWDSARGRVILFGGLGVVSGTETPFDDTWEYDVVTSTWAEVSTVGRPPPRFGHAMAYDAERARVVMSGGQSDPAGDDQSDFYDETWLYDPATHAWVKQPLSVERPGFRSGATMAYDPARKVSVLFGGRNDQNAVSADAREWNGSSWSLRVTPHRPDERTDQAMTYSAALGGIVMFGGVSVTGAPFELIYGDTWLYDGTDWTELPHFYLNGRSNHGITPGPNGTDLVVYGGFSNAVVADGTTLLRTSAASAWTTALTTGPPSLHDASMVQGFDGRIILFGGRTPAGDDTFVPSGDTWELRGIPPVLGPIGPAADSIGTPCVTNSFAAPVLAPELGPFQYQWRRLRNGGWEALYDHGPVSGTHTSVLKFDPLRATDAGTYDVSVTNACGTTSSSSAPGSGSFSIRLADGHWVPGKFLPAPRDAFAMGYDTDRQTMVIHGGHTQNIDFSYDFYDGTWESVAGGDWHFAADPGPSPRAFHAMAYDRERHRMVMYGGHWVDHFVPGSTPPANQTFDETWEYDGTTWTQMHPAQNPGPRTRHSMTWDPIRKRVVLFGGLIPGAFVAGSAMWEWDGANWTLRPGTGDDTIGPAGSPLGSPPGRDQTGFAFDTERGALVVHGGSSYFGEGQSANIKRGDTWEQIAGQWRRRSVVTDFARAAIGEHRAMAYDERHDATLLFTYSESIFGDELGILWGWNPTTAEWEEKPNRLPIYREKAAMAYDAGRERVVLAGGFRGCYAVGGGPKICNLDDTWEWEFFDFDPTCGIDACGDAYVDPGEECDTGGTGCCTAACKNYPAGTGCSDVCEHGTCNAGGSCVCPGGCGNGVVDSGETCDPPGPCCRPTCQVAYLYTPCGDACRGDLCQPVGGGPYACTVGTVPPDGCSAATSATGYIDDTGGSVATPDGSVKLTVPSAAVQVSTSYGIASGLATSDYGVGTEATRVVTARLTPDWAAFNAPGATLELRWNDADSNGLVDGTTIDEHTLRLYRNGVEIAGPCSILTPCTTSACCNTSTNTLRVQLLHFSEYVLVAGSPCGEGTTAKLSLTKMLPPAGDDGLGFTGTFALPATPPDPDLAGLGVVVSDAARTLVDVTLPAGAYDKASKTGWKVDKKRTKWTWSHGSDGDYGGLVKVTLASNAKKGVLKVGVKGARGDYAAAAPVVLALRFPGSGCARAGLAEGGRSCAVKGKGKSLVCK